MDRMPKEEFVALAEKFFPHEAINFIFYYFNTYGFSLNIKNPRATKKGDFRYLKDRSRPPTITLNVDLCNYEMLLVFLHELAHYFVYEKVKNADVKSHGEEWKAYFRFLIKNLTEQVELPLDIKKGFQEYAVRIKASSAIDKGLEQLFDRYRDADNAVRLCDLKIGDLFICSNKVFKLEKFARTRARCIMLEDGRMYSISGLMKVVKKES